MIADSVTLKAPVVQYHQTDGTRSAWKKTSWNHWNTQVTELAAKSSTVSRSTSPASSSKLRRYCPPAFTPSMRWSTSREAPKSGVEKKMRISVPVTPEAARVSMIRRTTAPISRRYTGKLRVSWPTTSCLASSPESTKPTVETPNRLSGMQQTRKKKASAAARNRPLSAKNRENAPRMASMRAGSEEPAHHAAVHLYRDAGHVGGTL